MTKKLNYNSCCKFCGFHFLFKWEQSYHLCSSENKCITYICIRNL